jgi:hypothetical protein
LEVKDSYARRSKGQVGSGGRWGCARHREGEEVMAVSPERREESLQRRGIVHWPDGSEQPITAASY